MPAKPVPAQPCELGQTVKKNEVPGPPIILSVLICAVFPRVNRLEKAQENQPQWPMEDHVSSKKWLEAKASKVILARTRVPRFDHAGK